MAAAGHPVPRTSGTGHAGTISVTARGAPRPQNAMKPRFQRALTRWKPGFTASGTRASSHDHHKLRGTGSGPAGFPGETVSQDRGMPIAHAGSIALTMTSNQRSPARRTTCGQMSAAGRPMQL